MAFDIQGLIVRVSEEGVKVTQEDLDKLTASSRKAEDAVEDLGTESKAATRTVEEFDVRVSHIGGTLGTLGLVMKGVPWILIATRMYGAAKAIIEVGAKYEVLESRLKSVAGSASAAEHAFAWIKQFAIDVPIGVSSLTDTFIRLQNVGIDPTAGALQGVVDAGFAVHGSLEGVNLITEQLAKSFGAGKMKTWELVSMIQAGIPASDILAEKLGVTAEKIEEMADAGKIGRREMRLLIEGIKERFAGAAADQMDNITGKIQQLGRAWEGFLHEMSDVGALDAVKLALDTLKDTLQDLIESGQGEVFAKAFGKAMFALAITIQTTFLIIPAAAKLAVASVKLIFFDMLSGLEKQFEKLAKVFIPIFRVWGALLDDPKMLILAKGLELMRDMSAGAAGEASALNIQVGDLTETLSDGVAAVLKSVNAMDALERSTKSAGDAAGDVGDGLAKADFQYFFQGFTLGMEEVLTGLTLYGESIDDLSETPKLRLNFEELTEGTSGLAHELEQLGPSLAGLPRHLNPAAVAAGAAAEKMKILRAEMGSAGYTVNQFLGAIQMIGGSTEQAVEALKALGYAAGETEMTFGHMQQIADAFGISVEELNIVLKWVAKYLGDAGKNAKFFSSKFIESQRVLDNFKSAVAGMFGDTFRALLEGEFESVGEMFNQFMTDIGQMAAEAFINTFIESLFEGDMKNLGSKLKDLFTGASGVAMGIGGAATLYSATTTPGMSGGERFLTGAMGGAGIGAAIGTPFGGFGGAIGAAIGAIVGGAIAYFGGGSETPSTGINIGPGWADVTGGGEGVTNPDRMVLEKEIAAFYRSMNTQWRDALRMFEDADLFGFVRDLPEISGEWGNTTLQDMEQWLRESKLPQMFQHRYARAIRTGLRNLGLTFEGVQQIWQEMQDLPGEERIELLTTVIRAISGVRDLLELDFDTMKERVGETVFDDYLRQMDDAEGAIDRLTLGWEEMSLGERAVDLEQIGIIFEAVTQDTMRMLAVLDQVSDQLSGMFEQTLSSFETRGMTDEELWSYYEGEYNRYRNLLSETDDPQEILDYTNNMLAILRAASGMLTDEQWLSPAFDAGATTWQDWFTRVTTDLQGQAEAAVAALEEQLRARYDAMYEQVDRVTTEFGTVADVLGEEVIPDLDDLPPVITPLIQAFIDLHDVLEPILDWRDEYDFGGSTKSGKGKIEVNIEPPVVVVNINGSIAMLDARIDTRIQQHARVAQRSALKAIS